VGDKSDAPIREYFESFHLDGEIGDVSEDRKLEEEPRPQMRVGEKELGISGVDEDAAEDEAADPDDDAAKIERAGLHHGLSYAV